MATSADQLMDPTTDYENSEPFAVWHSECILIATPTCRLEPTRYHLAVYECKSGEIDSVRGRKLSDLWESLEGSPQDWLSFAIGLVVVTAVVWLAIRFFARLRGGDDPAVVEHQMLNQMREMHRQGNLDENEYRSIKVRLADRLKKIETESESKIDG